MTSVTLIYAGVLGLLAVLASMALLIAFATGL
jgi:hypothetical protein